MMSRTVLVQLKGVTEDMYQNIVEDLEKNILQGTYKKKKLPSVRDLAKCYHCSQSTVVKAYESLKMKHIVYSVPQSGYYVLENLLKNEVVDNSVIDFSTGNPLIGKIHIPDLKHCLNRAVDSSNNYSALRDLHGTESLRNIMSKYLANFQVFTSPKSIFVNLGVQQALSMLTQMPFPNGKDVILIEQPTYRFFTDFLKHIGAKVKGIKRSEEGINLNLLEAIFREEKIKFFYTVPRNHNPLGTSYSKSERKAIAALAAKYDVYVVEDDYFGDVSSIDHKYDTIYTLGDHCHHIYLKSFSKIIPWFRIGLVVIPIHLVPMFEEYAWYSYYNSYFSASLVSQATLDIYIRSKLLEKHVSSIRKELGQRLKALRSGFRDIEKYQINCIGGESGFYSYLKLPEYINENLFINELRKQHVLVTSGRLYYIDDSFYEKGIRLSISRSNSREIEKGLQVIRGILEKYIK